MPRSFRSIGIFVTVLCCTVTVYGQDAETNKKLNGTYFMLGASVGNFSNGDGTKFEEIYSNRTVTRNYSIGIGSRMLLIIGKYHQFSATGRSIVANVAVDGKAEWNQKFYALGLRLRGDDHPLYGDILYVMTRAEESITTDAPKVEELTKSYTAENRGIGAAFGLAFKLAGIIGIFAELEYSTMTKLGKNQYGRTNPELGGLNYSAGLQLAF